MDAGEKTCQVTSRAPIRQVNGSCMKRADWRPRHRSIQRPCRRLLSKKGCRQNGAKPRALSPFPPFEQEWLNDIIAVTERIEDPQGSGSQFALGEVDARPIHVNCKREKQAEYEMLKRRTLFSVDPSKYPCVPNILSRDRLPGNHQCKQRNAHLSGVPKAEIPRMFRLKIAEVVKLRTT